MTAIHRATRHRAWCIIAGLSIFLNLSWHVAAQEPLGLAETFGYLETTSRRWLADEMALQEARLAYRRTRAIIYPVLDLSAPVSVNSTLGETFTTQVGPSTVEVQRDGAYSLSVSPGLTLRQSLPTGGTLSATLSDTVSVSDPGNFDPSSVGDSYPTDERVDHTLAFGLSLDQPLYFRGSAFAASLELAENTLGRAQLGRDRQRNQLAYEAASLYYEIQFLAYSRSLVASRNEASARRLETIEREFELGMHTRSVLLQAQLSLQKAEIDLYDAQRALDQTLGEFRGLYGLPEDASIGERVDTFPLREFDPDETLELALGANPDVKMLRLSVADAANAVIIYDAERAPRLSIGADLTYADRSEEDLPDRSTGLRGNVMITANLLDGRTARLRRDELALASSRAAIELEQAEMALRRDITSAIEDLERNRRYMDYLLAAVEVAAYEFDKGGRDRNLGVITDRTLGDLGLALEAARLEIARATVEDNLLRIRLLATQGEDIMQLVIAQEGAQS
jgi:outer membrane protein